MRLTHLSPSRSVPSPPAPPSGDAPRRARRVLLFVILAAQLMVVLDTTIVNVALPHIQEAFGFSSSDLSWVLNAYILTFGGLLLLGARAGDLLRPASRLPHRHRAVLRSARCSVGSPLTGWMLLAARALQGVGRGAGRAVRACPCSRRSSPKGRERVRAIGLYTTVSAAGGAIGLVVRRLAHRAGVVALGHVRQRADRHRHLGRRTPDASPRPSAVTAASTSSARSPRPPG